MPKTNVNITEDNIIEWVHSVGYFLPRNDKEDARFEILHADISQNLNVNAIDPVAILNGSWKPSFSIQLANDELEQEVTQLRMAARKHEDIPDEIFKKLIKNQNDNDSPNNTEG